MISFADQPFIVTLEDANGNPVDAEDGLDVLLLGVAGPNDNVGLILASGVLEWYPLSEIKVLTSLTTYERVEPEETTET